MIFDVLIIGGRVAGMQCALILGSAKNKLFAKDKKIGIILHQKSSHLESALFNNVLGLSPKSLGKDILIQGKKHLKNVSPHVVQIENEKVFSIESSNEIFMLKTAKNTYKSSIVIISLNYAKPFTIDGLDEFLIPHEKSNPEKDRIQLKNENHLIKKGLYCCGTISGCRSQFAISAGSGAIVATDILTLWNRGNHTQIHDKI